MYFAIEKNRLLYSFVNEQCSSGGICALWKHYKLNVFFRLFVEKLPKHPGYKEAPANEVTNIKQVSSVGIILLLLTFVLLNKLRCHTHF